MWLEAAVFKDRFIEAQPLTLARDEAGCWRADWEELIELCTDRRISAAQRATLFHEKMAGILLVMARRVREDTGVTIVGLSGGVFQNRVLLERGRELLKADGFTVLVPERIPVNDAGLSFGQLVEAAVHHTGTVSLRPK